MVDEERVTRLLAGVRADMVRLEALAERLQGPDPDPDPALLDAAKYRFVTAVEGCVRVAHHVGAAEGWAAADTNAGAVRALAEHGVVAAEVAGPVAAAVGFRNVLVHQYAEVDDRRVLDHLSRCDDLRRFVAAVTAWLDHPER